MVCLLANRILRCGMVGFWFLAILSTGAVAQTTYLEYSILKNGKTVGSLHCSCEITNEDVRFKVESNVNTHLGMPIKVETHEIAYYKKGVLQNSSVFRKVNDRVKVNKSLKIQAGYYIINQKQGDEVLGIYPIYRSISGIFCQEPLHVANIYSDNFQKMLPIHKTGLHEYKLTLPDGNYNLYYYENGFCTKVDVHNTFYSLQFVLKKH